ncbi:hypothetical protein KC909_01295 [Candidatus Dojkabacteria bacterium]|uniref:Uncharacterized protein n=1 Tax=Candidatus Dojkabacteria bacterium TaxID=2099670 RepID=A0A955RIK0_9BACT|nr:hypothetical protein [Candidatus Dojkabacteria bacterium]
MSESGNAITNWWAAQKEARQTQRQRTEYEATLTPQLEIISAGTTTSNTVPDTLRDVVGNDGITLQTAMDAVFAEAIRTWQISSGGGVPGSFMAEAIAAVDREVQAANALFQAGPQRQNKEVSARSVTLSSRVLGIGTKQAERLQTAIKDENAHAKAVADLEVKEGADAKNNYLRGMFILATSRMVGSVPTTHEQAFQLREDRARTHIVDFWACLNQGFNPNEGEEGAEYDFFPALGQDFELALQEVMEGMEQQYAQSETGFEISDPFRLGVMSAVGDYKLPGRRPSKFDQSLYRMGKRMGKITVIRAVVDSLRANGAQQIEGTLSQAFRSYLGGNSDAMYQAIDGFHAQMFQSVAGIADQFANFVVALPEINADTFHEGPLALDVQSDEGERITAELSTAMMQFMLSGNGHSRGRTNITLASLFANCPDINVYEIGQQPYQGYRQPAVAPQAVDRPAVVPVRPTTRPQVAPRPASTRAPIQTTIIRQRREDEEGEY